jgi:hypothetical protein
MIWRENEDLSRFLTAIFEKTNGEIPNPAVHGKVGNM